MPFNLDLAAGNLLGYDPNQFVGLLDSADVAKARQQAILGTGLGLLNAGGRSTQPVNFGQAFAQAAMMGQQQGQGALQQAMMMRQAMEQKERQKRIGAAVGGIVPQQYAQLAQDAPELALGLAPKPQAPQAFTAGDGSVRWAMPGQNLGPVARPGEMPKFDIKPIYDLQGNLMGEGRIDPMGNAFVGGQALPTGSYTTAKPDKTSADAGSAAQQKYQTVKELGALAGADLDLIDPFLADPTTMGANLKSPFTGLGLAGDRVKASIEEAKLMLERAGGKAAVAPNTPAPQLGASIVPPQGVARGQVVTLPSGATLTYEKR
jgi:hypothetical protein